MFSLSLAEELLNNTSSIFIHCEIKELENALKIYNFFYLFYYYVSLRHKEMSRPPKHTHFVNNYIICDIYIYICSGKHRNFQRKRYTFQKLETII